MGATSKLTDEDWEKLPREGASYELDEGELLMEPSPAIRPNLIRQRIFMHLAEFVRSPHLRVVVEEIDFRLGPDTVRNPDVAYITTNHFQKLDPDRSPVDGAPALAGEVISPNNLAQDKDTAKKLRPYLAAGCRAVWVVYPALRLAELHDAGGMRGLTEGESLSEDRLFAGHNFSLPLAVVFDPQLAKMRRNL